MDSFEKHVEDLDVQSQYIEGSIANSSTLTTPDAQVQELMQEVADENNLELGELMVEAPMSFSSKGTAAVTPQEEDELTERLAKLRSTSRTSS